ncbi:MAG: hypothetical protein JXQ23_07260 [Clostridia bacterium]|nr:hypothetical protein [Clostridia bacterium]
MKKKVLVTLLAMAILININFTACKKNEKTADNEPDSNRTPEVTIVLSEMEKELASLDTDYKAGKVNESDYHASRLEVFVKGKSTDISSEEDIENTTKIPVDMSLDIQWMIDHYDTLSDKEKAMVDDITSMPGTDNEASSSFFSIFTRTVHAEEEPYSVEIGNNAILFADNAIIGEHVREAVEEAYIDASLQYDQYLGMILDTPIRFFMEPLGIDVESFSYQKQEILLDEPVRNAFYIHINPFLSDDYIKASVYHELFHAYQYALEYDRLIDTHRFVMESTAIWAVLFMDESIGYHLRYSDPVYQNPSLKVEDMSENDMKSWYQLYYFYYTEMEDTTLNERIIKEMPTQADFMECLLTVLGKDHRIHNMMAYFAQYLFAERDMSDIPFKANSPLADKTFSIDIADSMTHEEMMDKRVDNWIHYNLTYPGYQVVNILPGEDQEAFLNITSDLGIADEKKKAGMVVFGETGDGKWKLILNGRYDTFVGSVDFKKENIEMITIIFFSYDTDSDTSHAFQWDYEQRIKGEGLIEIEVHTMNNMIDSFENKDYNIVIVEDIERYNPDSTGELGAYQDLIIGDMYFVNQLEMTFQGKTSFEDNGEDGSKLKMDSSYIGTYEYKQGDLGAGAFTNQLIQLPQMDIGSPGEASLGDALSGLGGLGGMEGLGDLPGLSDMLNDAKDMLDEEMGNFLPPLDYLIRMKENSESKIFHFYQQMPSNIGEKEWIHKVQTNTMTDADGEVDVYNLESDEQLMESLFPTWFYNPFYDPEAAKSIMESLPQDPLTLVDQFNSTEDIMTQVAAINGLFDKGNLYDAINQGALTVDISIINPKWTGSQTQELSYIEKTFSGRILANFTDDIGTNYIIEISFSYDFSR